MQETSQMPTSVVTMVFRRASKRFHEAVTFAMLVIPMLIATGSMARAQDLRVLNPNAAMYPGETLVEVAGHQALYKFVPGDPEKPLIVFVPGTAHLARIFYGFPDGRSEDFVAHWVGQSGHPFLAVSYPMASPVFEETAPGYTIEDWGNQVAAVIAYVAKENALTAPVIVCGWSMGGKIAASVGRAARALGTELAMFVAMSADPPVTGFLPAANAKSIKLDGNGHVDRTSIYDWFLNAVAEQSAYNGHTIIPKDIYTNEFIGAVPADLIDTGLIYENGKLVSNLAKAIQTSNAMTFDDYPFPVVVHDTSRSDLENVLLDVSDWAFVRNRVLINRYLGRQKPSDITVTEWEQLRLLVNASQDFFTEVVNGNHFFFIGEIGARTAVEKILALNTRVESLPKARR